MTLAADMGVALLATAGEPATYTPPNGLPVPTRASGPQRIRRVRADGLAVEVVSLVRLPATDVPQPQRGGTVAIGADVWLIEGLDSDDGAVVAVTVRAP